MSFYKLSTYHYSNCPETKTRLIINRIAGNYLFSSTVNKYSHTKGLGHTFNRSCLLYDKTIYLKPSSIPQKYYSKWIYFKFYVDQTDNQVIKKGRSVVRMEGILAVTLQRRELRKSHCKMFPSHLLPLFSFI